MFLFGMCLLGAVYGIILISSAVGRSSVYVQIGAVVVGVVFFVLFSYIDIDVISAQSKLLFVFSALFILTLIPWGAGDEIGRRAWLRFGQIGVQPAEIVKIPFTIIMAQMIVSYRERKTLNSVVSLLQILFVFGMMFALVLVVSEDLGTALVYLGILVVMLYIGGVKLRWFILGGAVTAAAFPFLLNYVFLTHQRERILAPFARFFPDILPPDRLADVTWQPNMSVSAIAGGGFTGQGLGNGAITQRGFFALETDFIFAVAGEELGFVGLMAIVLLLVLIIARCIYVGTKSNNPLGMLVCTGISAMFIVQAIMNIGMALGLLPVVGVPLPFFSYGGSSVVTYFAAAGIVSGIKMRPKPVRFRSL